MAIKDKKAQGLQLNTLILIVLGVIILVVLIYGFTVGWNKILPWIDSPDNVDEIGTQCALSCSLLNEYDFCSKQRTIEVDGETSVTGSCNDLDTDATYGSYIDSCSSITCDPVVVEVTAEICDGRGATAILCETDDKCEFDIGTDKCILKAPVV